MIISYFFIARKSLNFLFFVNRDSKSARSTRQKNTFAELVKSATNPPTYQKYFLPARQLSNLPELSKSGGENCHLATLTQ
jgi:hypothetical protein